MGVRINQNRNFAAFAPLKAVMFFIIATFLIAVFGPVVYRDFAVGKTSIFIGAILMSMTVGYTMGVQSMVRARALPSTLPLRKMRSLFDISLGVAFLDLALTIFVGLGSGSINTSFSSIGTTYISGYAEYERNTGDYSALFLLDSITLPFSFIATIWGIFYFFNFDKKRQVLIFFVVVAGGLLELVGSGKQKAVGYLLIYLLAVSYVKYGVKRVSVSWKGILRGISGAVLAVAAFVTILGQRYAAIDVDVYNINDRTNLAMQFDVNHPVFKVFGPDIGFGLAVFSSYLSQGYYGLSLALNTDWYWTRMTGFSYSISVIFDRLFGFDWQWPNTIVYRVGSNTGWGESKWHTAFSHFASDFTWPGTVLLFGVFAFIYARTWMFSIRNQNPYAILMFSLITLGVVFIPANNQLFHSPGSLLTLIIITILYINLGHLRIDEPEAGRKIPRIQQQNRVTLAR